MNSVLFTTIQADSLEEAIEEIEILIHGFSCDVNEAPDRAMAEVIEAIAASSFTNARKRETIEVLLHKFRKAAVAREIMFLCRVDALHG